MQKKIALLLISFLYAIPNMAQSGDKSNPPIQQNHRQELSGGFFWHPRGLGLNVKSVKKIDGPLWRVLDFDLVSMKHAKERRVRSSSFSAPGSYFFGKLNYTYFLRAGYGRRWDLGFKLYKNTIASRVQVSIGPTIALLKPVYLEIYYPTPDQSSGFLVSEKYDPITHDDPAVIFGNSSFIKGLGETKGRIGLNLKANIQFDWSDFNDQVQSIELGTVIDAFGNNIPILATAKNKNIFTSLYICFNIGNRW